MPFGGRRRKQVYGSFSGIDKKQTEEPPKGKGRFFFYLIILYCNNYNYGMKEPVEQEGGTMKKCCGVFCLGLLLADGYRQKRPRSRPGRERRLWWMYVHRRNMRWAISRGAVVIPLNRIEE